MRSSQNFSDDVEYCTIYLMCKEVFNYIKLDTIAYYSIYNTYMYISQGNVNKKIFTIIRARLSLFFENAYRR